MRKIFAIFAALSVIAVPVNASRSFNGTSDEITVPSTMGGPTDIYASTMTLSVWFYFNQVGDAEHGILSKQNWNSSPGSQYAIVVGHTGDCGTLYSIVGSVGSGSETGNYTCVGNSSNITTGKWYNATFVVTTSDYTLYVNNGVGSSGGGLIGGSGANRTSNSVPISIGYEIVSNSAANFFKGYIAEAGIWNTALSAGEIAALQGGVSPNHIRRTNLVGYFPLWGASGSSIEPDLSGTGQNGTLTGTSVAQHCPCSQQPN